MPENEQNDELNTETEEKLQPIGEDSESTEPIDEDNASEIGEVPESESAETPAAEKIIYRWEYSEAIKPTAQAPQSRKSGIRTFTLIMAAAFVVSFAILAAALILKPDTVYYDSGSEAVADMIDDVIDTVVVISATSDDGSGSTGSGIVFSADGYIITNEHVVSGASNVVVKFHNGKTYKASVVGTSEWDDIAVLKVSETGLHYAQLSDSSECRTGESVYAIGAPAGADYGWSTTRGIISSATRYLKVYSNSGVLTKRIKVIQTDAPVNNGNSGGPLFNASGKVVGVISMKLSDGYENMGFALPINEVMVIVDELIVHGNTNGITSPLATSRPLIGITGVGVDGGKHYIMQENQRVLVDEKDLGKYNSDEIFSPEVSGVYVSSVTEGYDAANYLKKGDIIVAVNDVEVLIIYDVMDVINELSDGDSVKVRFYRDGEYREANIKLKYEKTVK